jgi:hypothetical protein
VDPSRSSDNKTLNSKEITELIDTWEPESIVPTLGDEEEDIANDIKVYSNVYIVHSFLLSFICLLSCPTNNCIRLLKLLLETT